MEVGGHDHFTSMRYHTERCILDTETPGATDTSLFHNILINPSMTPWYSNNPGISAMEICDDTLVPHHYQATYLNLKETIGKETRTPYSMLTWRDVDYFADYGIDELTPLGIHKFRVKLQEDPELQREFMIRKIGLDPNCPIESKQAMDIFIEKGLVDEDTKSAWPQICLMAKSMYTAEFASCVAKDPTTKGHRAHWGHF